MSFRFLVRKMQAFILDYSMPEMPSRRDAGAELEEGRCKAVFSGYQAPKGRRLVWKKRLSLGQRSLGSQVWEYPVIMGEVILLM